MPSSQHNVRLLIVVFTIPLFSISAASVRNSASLRESGGNRALAFSPSSLSFGNIQMGSSQTRYETLTNPGNSTLTISQARITGAGFSLTGLSLPLTLNRGQSVTFGVILAPTVAGRISGGVSVVSNASNRNLTIALAGTSIPAGQLIPSATALNFGSVTVGTSKTLTATLTAAKSSVTVSSATSTSAEFRLGGLSVPKTIAAGQNVSFTLTFTPQSSGTASGSISLISNAANTPTLETLVGLGTATGSHSVSLYWNPSSSAVAGYNLYRSAKPGGPYTKITPALAANTSYVDSSVQGGTTYYYVSTAVDPRGLESKYSNQLTVVVPSP